VTETATAGDTEAITYLTPVRPSAFPSEWYEISSVDHFWFKWRLKAALELMALCGAARNTSLRALDIGGGSGLLRDQIESHTRWTVDLTDLNSAALRSARRGRGRTIYYDVLQCEPNLREAYDVAVLFDVLEHVEETRRLLGAIAKHLRGGGLLFINVPALPLLMSAYDRAAGHLRRYRPESLRAELATLDFEILAVRYWGLSLLPLLALRKLILGGTPTAATIRRGFRPPSRLLHAGLRGLMAIETSLLPLPPIGTSLLLVARRK
jgi:SAM-dependent methyltransferase